MFKVYHCINFDAQKLANEKDENKNGKQRN